MKHYIKPNLFVQPLWKITLKNDLWFYVFGKTKSKALKTILSDSLINYDDIFSVENISSDMSKHILVCCDDDEESLCTLFDEAMWVQDNFKEFPIVVAAGFDVIADLNTQILT